MWCTADLGRLGEENLGIWCHKMKILRSSAPPCVGLQNSMEGECIIGVSGMPQQFQPHWESTFPSRQWDDFAGFDLQK